MDVLLFALMVLFSVISLILNFSRLLLIKAGLNRLKLIKATGWHKFNLSRFFQPCRICIFSTHRHRWPLSHRSALCPQSAPRLVPALFLRIRGVSQLGAEFRLPTCANVFNIYHPFDPVSFRIEPLIDASNVRRRPVLVPHHKGRKRMHLGKLVCCTGYEQTVRCLGLFQWLLYAARVLIYPLATHGIDIYTHTQW